MPKKKKNKNADFQKVKFKVGRKVQRATNETQAQFKVKSINIRGQFKQGQTFTEVAGKKVKDLNIKETLKHCSHHSSSFRLQALTSLCDYVSSSNVEELFTTHLGPALDVIGTLFTDDDVKVRAEMRKLLKVVTNSNLVRANDIGAFFSLIIARLCCAMTHLHEDIRLDSLLVLDVLLAKYPSLVATYALRLLPNFIGLISRPRTIRADASGHRQKSAASLIVNPNSQMSTQKWRVRVLERVGKLFDAIVANLNHHRLDVYGNSPFVAVRDDEVITHSFIDQPSAVSLSSLDSFSIRPSERENAGNDESSAIKVQPWIQSLVSLVLDCWVEAGLNSADQWDTMTDESLLVARSVLALLLSLFDYVSFGFENSESLVEMLAKNHEKQFVQNIMSEFPYVIGSVHSVKKKRHNFDQSKSFEITSVSINLSVCLVMLFFLKPVAVSNKAVAMTRCYLSSERVRATNSCRSYPPWHTNIVDYIVDVLLSDQDLTKKLGSEQLHRIFSLVSRLTQLPIGLDDCNRLIKACCETASNHEPLSWQAKSWFDFLFKFLLDDTKCSLNLTGAATRWVASLPSMFLACGPANDEHAKRVLTALLKAGNRQYPEFLQSFDKVFDQLLDSSFIQRLNPGLVSQFVESFNWVPVITTNTIQLLAILAKNHFSAETVRLLLGILQYRYEMVNKSGSNEHCLDENHLFVLMQTVLIRASKVDLQKAEPVGDDGVISIHCDSSSVSFMQQKWSEQLLMIEHVFAVVNMMPNKREVSKCFGDFLQHIMVTYRGFPLMTACSIAVCVVRLVRNDIVLPNASLASLLIGLCTCVCDFDCTNHIESDSNYIRRLVAELCVGMVSHASSTALLLALRNVIGGRNANEAFVACFTARIPNLMECSV